MAEIEEVYLRVPGVWVIHTWSGTTLLLVVAADPAGGEPFTTLTRYTAGHGQRAAMNGSPMTVVPQGPLRLGERWLVSVIACDPDLPIAAQVREGTLDYHLTAVRRIEPLELAAGFLDDN